jgi:hypothetical protein
MGVRLGAHYLDRSEAVVVKSMLDAAGLAVFLHGHELIAMRPFGEIGFGGFRLVVREEDLAATLAVLEEARAKPLFEGERLSTTHLAMLSLACIFVVGTIIPLKRHRWRDVSDA